MKLPFGGTLLGLNLYTRLLISAMALFLLFSAGKDAGVEGLRGGNHRHQLLLVPLHNFV